MPEALVLDSTDNVAVAVRTLAAGETVVLGGRPDAHAHAVTLTEEIRPGHKFALEDIPTGGAVRKFSAPIGHATEDIATGAWIHSHNLSTNLGPDLAYEYRPKAGVREPGTSTRTFQGYVRATGDVGIRNDLYLVPTVGCINAMCQTIADQFKRIHSGDNPFTSVIVTAHPYGCSQLGGDLEMTQRILRDIIRHPNAGGVLVIGLGCENNQMELMKAGLGDYDTARVRFIVAQEAQDEIGDSLDLLDELAEAAKDDRREEVPLSKLRVGMKCGGSDGFSGITANALIGRFADYVADQGGSVVLTEVPEMFGAETFLMERTKDEKTFERLVDLINGFKDYFRRYGQPIYENPSPGNKEGGITTLEEKSLGCIQKSGTTQVRDVLSYGERVHVPGVSLLEGPGNDLVSSSALASAGCQLVLFSTGRGTPFGTYVPTVKISSNSDLANRKKRWIDFDAGRMLTEPAEDVLDDFIEEVLGVVNGVPTHNEEYGMQEIAIFKDGVTE